MQILASILTLVAWVGAGILLILLYQIGRFYQVTAKQASYYKLFLIPLALLLAGGARYAWIGTFAGDLFGDGLQLAGGLLLIVLGFRLLHLMTGGRR